MQVEQLTAASGRVIEGPLLITPKVFGDDRGFFYESWNQRRFDEAVGCPTTFVQDNHSRSCRGVLRGLHYQLEPEPQGKLVRCPVGVIFDVAVDLRRSSATFGEWGWPSTLRLTFLSDVCTGSAWMSSASGMGLIR